MARSNGPFGPAGARPSARRHPADDPFAPPQPTQQPQYGEPRFAPPPPPAPAPAPTQGYHFPPEPEPNFGFGQQQPPFERYHPGAQDPYAQQQQPHAPHPHQQHDPYAHAQWGQQDPRGYDLGSYTPNNGAQPPYPSNGAQGYPSAPPGFSNAAGGPSHAGPGFPNGAQQHQQYPNGAHYQDAQPGFPNGLSPYGDPAQQPYQNGHDPYGEMEPGFDLPGADRGAYAQQEYAEGDGEYDGEHVEEEEEPPRGRRWIFIAAALVGAIGVGGALAYTYKSFTAPHGGRVPLVKAEPNMKVRAADTRSLPSADNSRLQGRLGDESPQRASAAVAEPQDDRGSDEPGGPRRVRTIPITPGGSPPGIQVSQPPPVQASAPPVVPGIMLDNMAPRSPPPAPPQAAPAGGPQRVTIGQPPPQMQAAAPQAHEPAAPPARKVAAPPAQPVAVKAAPPPPPPAAAQPARAAPAPASTGAGYVAVLSSQKTRMDALKAFADLQQKYGDALSGRVPDVQEADLGAKGVWYRAVVGPPGSREAANGVCNQLKSAGYSNCWVNAY